MARKRQLTEFGVRVKSELDRKGWTQRELADKCGINYRVVHDVLVGLNRKPENVRRIKEVLEFVDIAGLVKGCLLYTSPSPRDRG